MSIPYSTNYTALNAVTVTTTGSLFDVSKRQQISATLTAAGVSSGNGVFSFDVSNDGTNWAPKIQFIDCMASTGGQLWVTSKTLSSITTAACLIPAGFRYIRANVVVTTDGAYSTIFQTGG